MTDFTDEMDKLAAELAKNANMAATSFGDRLDAFKALMPYYVVQMKHKSKEVDDDDLPTFDNFTASIHASDSRTPADSGGLWEQANGSDEPGVRGHSGRNGSGNA